MSKIRLVLLGLLAVLGVSAIASASASAVMPAYTDSAGNLFTGQLQILSEKTVAGEKAFLKSTLAGVKIEIACTEERGTGWIENSVATGMGLSLGNLHYTSCTFIKAPGVGCLIKFSLIFVSLVHNLLLLHGGPGKFLIDFFPDNGSIFTKIVVHFCTNESLNGEYPVTGSASALVNNTTLSYEFSAETGSKLEFGGNPATYEDKITTLMLGGGGIMIENGS